jgi:PEP-CTERM motif-containing protein
MSVRRVQTLMKQVALVCGAAIVLLCAAGRADAAPFELQPADTTCINNGNPNLSKATDVLPILAGCFGATSPLSLLYKAGVGESDEGTFAASYDTIFSNAWNDPQDATILNVGGNYMGCSACYLLVKGGNADPSLYAFNISSWNGRDQIQLTEFWPDEGAISNVAIWGRAVSLPEPGTLVLFSAGLGLASLRRRRTA